jgi:hypothetical protein
MIAIKRLQSIMWILVVAMGALSAYLISLRVATERNALHALERGIYATKANIRYLEVEFSARSTMSQLETWNRHAIRYSVPRAGQFLTSERQLAMLVRPAPAGLPAETPTVMAAVAPAPVVPELTLPVRASAPVPAPTPVRVAVVDRDMSGSRPVAAASKAQPVVAVAKLRSVAVITGSQTHQAVATPLATATVRPATVALIDKASPTQRRAMRLALLDKTLLGTSEAGR